MRLYYTLRRYMRYHGFTQADVALNLRISESSLSDKMSGRTEFTIPEAMAICDLLKIHRKMAYVLFDKEDTRERAYARWEEQKRLNKEKKAREKLRAKKRKEKANEVV